MAHEKASSMIADNAPEVAVPAPVSPILALRRRPFSTSRWTGCGRPVRADGTRFVVRAVVGSRWQSMHLHL